MTPFELAFLPDGPNKGILEACLKWTATQGLFKLTMAEVARQAGVSRPFLNYHYKSLDEILEDLAKAWAHSGQTVTLDYLTNSLGSKPEDLIMKIVEATFVWKKKCPHFAYLTPTLNQMAVNNSNISKLLKLTTDTGVDRMKKLLDSKMKGRESDKLARTLHIQLVGGFLYHLSTVYRTDSQMERDIKDSMNLILRI